MNRINLLDTKTTNKIAALISAFLVSISPWLFIFSRTGYEATAGLTLYLLSIYILLISQKNKLLIILSTMSLILSMYSYTTFRLLAIPTFFALLIVLSCTKENWLQYWKVACISIILFVLSIIPIIRLVALDSGFGRIQTLSFLPTIRLVTGPTGKTEWQIINASKSAINVNFIGNYLSHFNPDFLFLNGDKNPRSQQLGFGQLYWLDLPLFILGLLYMYKKKNRMMWFIIVPLLLAPIPASLTSEAPHALRSIVLAPFLAYISALGILFLSQFLKTRYIIGLILIIYLSLFGNYYYHFLTGYASYSSKDWQIGYKEIFTRYKPQFNNFEHIIVSNQYGQPHIFAMFYQKLDPNTYISEVSLNSPDNWGFSTVNRIGKYQFEKVSKQNLPSGHSLIFTTELDKLEIPPKEIIRNWDNSTAFYVYDYQK